MKLSVNTPGMTKEDFCTKISVIVGKDVIVSMVERSSKLTRLAKVNRKTAENVSQSLLVNLEPMKAFVHTLTAHNRSEFAYHQKVSQRPDAGFYFAKPYHSWKRGLNEHTNGLVRQYFPKKTNFKNINFETPIERFERLSKI